MDISELKQFVDDRWDQDLVPRLMDYIRVPAKSPQFDPNWAAHGHLGPNEHLHIPYAKRLTQAVASVVAQIQ